MFPMGSDTLMGNNEKAIADFRKALEIGTTMRKRA